MGMKTGGIMSGLDIENIVKATMEVEKMPLTRIAKEEADYQAKISSYGLLAGSLSDLQGAAMPLSNPKNFSTYNAVSSDPSIITVENTDMQNQVPII